MEWDYDEDECRLCGIGFYRNAIDSFLCMECTPGYVTPNEGAGNVAQCTIRKYVNY